MCFVSGFNEHSPHLELLVKISLDECVEYIDKTLFFVI